MSQLSDRQKKELQQAISNDNLASVVSEIINNLVSGVGVDLAQGSVLVGDSSGISSVVDASGDGEILIGDGSDLNAVAVSGDITINNAGVTAIGADKVLNSMIADDAVETAKINADAVDNSKIADDAVSLENLDSGVAPTGYMVCVAAEAERTMSPEENIDLLASALALDAALFVTMNAHAADGAEHFAGGVASPDNVNFPLVEASSDIASLIVSVSEKITAYVAHDTDADAGTPTFHNARIVGGDPLVSAVAPTTLVECVTRLNDIKAKFNDHDADAGGHTVGSQHQEATADAAAGAANLISSANVLAGDVVVWSILDDGSGVVDGVSAATATGEITFTFSANPQDDAIISYQVMRTAA